MAVNEFLPFATDPLANVETQLDYAGSAHQTKGFSAGVAQSAQVNKAIRQSSFVASGLAQVLSELKGVDLHDDGNFADFKGKLKQLFFASYIDPRNLQSAPGPVTSDLNTVLIKANTLTPGSIIKFQTGVIFNPGVGGATPTMSLNLGGVGLLPSTTFGGILRGIIIINPDLTLVCYSEIVQNATLPIMYAIGPTVAIDPTTDLSLSLHQISPNGATVTGQYLVAEISVGA